MTFPIRPGQVMGKPFSESVPDHVEALFPGIRARLPRRHGFGGVPDDPTTLDDTRSAEEKLADLKSFLAAREDTLTVEDDNREFQRGYAKSVAKVADACLVDTWRHSPDDQLVTAAHEAGHALAAILLWNRPGVVGRLEIGWDGEGFGSVVVDPPVIASQADRLTVLAAGQAAADLCTRRNLMVHQGDGCDRSQMAQLLGVDRIDRDSPAWDAAYGRAVQLLERGDNFKALMAAARLLYHRRSLSGREFLDCVREYPIG